MARKIIGGIGSLLGIKKKKADPVAAPAEPKARFTPVVKDLGSAEAERVRRLARPSGAAGSTILSDKLGG